jgi:hypothetical protein
MHGPLDVECGRLYAENFKGGECLRDSYMDERVICLSQKYGVRLWTKFL